MLVNLLFPVETIHRELDFRVVLAERMASRGYRVYIGKHEACMRVAEHQRGGIFFGKGGIEPHQTGRLERLEFLKRRGYRFVHLDTEGAVYPGRPDQWRRILDTRIDPSVLGPDDYICTWGDFQRDHYRSTDPACAPNIRTTGHPRFDLYKPEFRDYFGPQADGIRSRFGDFVLVNTNLAKANHKAGVEMVFSPAGGYFEDDPDKRTAVVDTWFYKTQMLAHFVRMVHEVATRRADLTFVVRPHPSEDERAYEHAFRGLRTVHVCREGAVSGWLLACAALIHDGCTTGIEAHLAGCPIINFRPVDHPTQELLLPNSFGRRCTTACEVLQALDELPGATDGVEPPELARALLENFRSDSFLRVEDLLAEVARTVTTSESPNYRLLRGVEVAHDALERAKRVVRPWSPRRMRQWLHSQQKFAGFDAVDLTQRFARAARIVGAKARHTLLGRELVVVEPDGPPRGRGDEWE